MTLLCTVHKINHRFCCNNFNSGTELSFVKEVLAKPFLKLWNQLMRWCHRLLASNRSDFSITNSVPPASNATAWIAEVMVYCLNLCSKLELDPIKIINEKMKHNAEKYPIEKSLGNSKKYSEYWLSECPLVRCLYQEYLSGDSNSISSDCPRWIIPVRRKFHLALIF